MKKLFLILFILFDAAVIFASGVFLVGHIRGTPIPIRIPGMAMPLTAPATPAPAPSAVPSLPTAAAPALAPGAAPAPTPAVTGAPATAASSTSHKIGFTYRNSRAKKVMIRAEFTGWRAEPMEKDASNAGTWKYMAVLEPGEYAYCYSVDDKSIRDPANKRTKLVGKTVVSLIVVPSPKSAPH